MCQRQFLEIVVGQTEIELVEVIQIPSVQGNGITYTDDDQIADGDETSKVSPQQRNNGQQITDRADKNEDQSVDA